MSWPSWKEKEEESIWHLFKLAMQKFQHKTICRYRAIKYVDELDFTPQKRVTYMTGCLYDELMITEHLSLLMDIPSTDRNREKQRCRL